jgi:hypothetical protein
MGRFGLTRFNATHMSSPGRIVRDDDGFAWLVADREHAAG